MKNMTDKIKLDSFDDLFGGTPASNTTTSDPVFASSNEVAELPLASLHPFKDHPFEVRDDAEMDALVSSIIDSDGLVNPILVRPTASGYEILSGHRRAHAYKLLGKETIPAYVREVSDSDAMTIMIYSNEYRETILPSERAKAYKMALNNQKSHQSTGFTTTLEASLLQRLSITKQQVYKVAKLAELVSELMQWTDEKKLTIKVGYELAFLREEEQQMLVELLSEEWTKIDEKKAKHLKELSEKRELTKARMERDLYNRTNAKAKRGFSLPTKKVSEYFPDNYSNEEIAATIYQLLDEWRSKQIQNEKTEEE